MKSLTMEDFASDYQHIVIRYDTEDEVKQAAFDLIEEHYKHLHVKAWFYVLEKLSK